jgi:hypothetical protein
VSQQIVIYVFARVFLALAKLAVQSKSTGGWGLLGDGGADGRGSGALSEGRGGGLRGKVIKNGWPAFASLSWAMVMYLFRWHPETVQSSLRSSMSYMWVIPVSLFLWASILTLDIVTYSRTTGIRYGTLYGTINKLFVRLIRVEIFGFMYRIAASSHFIGVGRLKLTIENRKSRNCDYTNMSFCL